MPSYEFRAYLTISADSEAEAIKFASGFDGITIPGVPSDASLSLDESSPEEVDNYDDDDEQAS